MNERTLELAKQAGLKVESWMTNPPKPFQILGSTEQFEKFAELIVRECVNIVENNNPCPPGTIKMYHLDQDEYFDRGWQVAVETKSNQIQKHFGVEE